MVITQASGGTVVPTEEKIQRVRDIIAANPVISADVADELERIGSSAILPFEKAILDKIRGQSEKNKKKRELAASSAYNNNRGFEKAVKKSL
jgi:hypothetical protein